MKKRRHIKNILDGGINGFYAKKKKKKKSWNAVISEKTRKFPWK